MTAISNFKKAAQMMRRRQKQHRINKMLLTCGINSVSIYRFHMETKVNYIKKTLPGSTMNQQSIIWSLKQRGINTTLTDCKHNKT